MLFQAILQHIQLILLHKQIIPSLVLHHQINLTIIRSGKYNVRIQSILFQKLHMNVKADSVNIPQHFFVWKHIRENQLLSIFIPVIKGTASKSQIQLRQLFLCKIRLQFSPCNIFYCSSAYDYQIYLLVQKRSHCSYNLLHRCLSAENSCAIPVEKDCLIFLLHKYFPFLPPDEFPSH